MRSGHRPVTAFGAVLVAFARSRRASSAVEFSIVAAPFIFTLLAILQMSIYYMTQSALDAGVLGEADTLVSSFYGTSTPTAPTAAALKAAIAAKAGGLVQATTMLADLQPLTNLVLLPVVIGANPSPSVGVSPMTVLALRAQAPVTAFAPYFNKFMVVRSSVVIRRQAQ